MTFRQTLLGALTAAATLATAANANEIIVSRQGVPHDGQPAAKYAVLRHLPSNIHAAARTATPPTWTFSFKYKTKTYHETFVGTAPSSNATTTIPVYIVPLKLVTGSTSEDPTVVTENGASVIQNVLNSPIFTSSVDYKQGSVDLGTTQYEDAFQRATVWGQASSNPNYHLLLSTKVLAVQTLTLPKGHGSVKSPYGQKIIAADINTVDAKLNALITSLNIPANALPLFITTNAYLYSGTYAGGCCIGGYHSVTSAGQPYSHATFITKTGTFAEDISALSHELGEWIDDPNTNNTVPSACGTGAVLEVGDPLEGNTNFGTYPYTVGGVTWHPQDLVMLPYFGAPTATSVNGWSTFQGETLAFCSNGG